MATDIMMQIMVLLMSWQTDLLSDKLKNLTEHIESAFGKRPLSFRSGRYGFNENVARVLVENGYLIDSSVTPLLSWDVYKGIPGGNGGPDFVDSDPFPSRFNFPGGFAS